MTRISGLILLSALIVGCGGGGSKNTSNDNASEVKVNSLCVNQKPSYVFAPPEPEELRSWESSRGDGSDGELYLTSGEVFALESRTYNYSNIYLEEGALITLTDELFTEGDESIRVNSLGTCNLFGDIDAFGYRGSLGFYCGELTSVSLAISIPNDATVSFLPSTHYTPNNSEGIQGSFIGGPGSVFSSIESSEREDDSEAVISDDPGAVLSSGSFTVEVDTTGAGLVNFSDDFSFEIIDSNHSEGESVITEVTLIGGSEDLLDCF